MSKALTLFAVNPGGALADNASLMLYTRLSEVLYFAAHIHDPDNISELHSMRIAAKRLRYTLEIFAPAYTEKAEEYAAIFETVKACQEKIGEIHDTDVRTVQIREYLNQNVVKKPEIRIGLQSLIEREAASRRGLYDDFVAFWESVSAGNKLEQSFVDLIFSIRVSTAPQAESPKSRPHASRSLKNGS